MYEVVTALLALTAEGEKSAPGDPELRRVDSVYLALKKQTVEKGCLNEKSGTPGG